jgi:hypothetical protein
MDGHQDSRFHVMKRTNYLQTKNRVCLAVFSLRVRPDQRSKIVILDLLFIPTIEQKLSKGTKVNQ